MVWVLEACRRSASDRGGVGVVVAGAALMIAAAVAIALASAVAVAWRPVHARPLEVLRQEG